MGNASGEKHFNIDRSVRDVCCLKQNVFVVCKYVGSHLKGTVDWVCRICVNKGPGNDLDTVVCKQSIKAVQITSDVPHL